MSWLEKIRRFMGGTPGPAPLSFDPAAFIALCESDPEQARRMLAADQYALAKEIEATFEAYDERLRELAGRVHALTPKQFAREAKRIREAHDALRRALRRLEASVKTAKEIERELSGWEDREDEAPLHADHPRVRAEILRSELRARGLIDDERPVRIVGARLASPVPLNVNPFLWLTHDDRIAEEPEESQMAESAEPLEQIDVRSLLAAIRDATREAERWHGVPSASHDEDALVQVRHVRDLHALLKSLDREEGMTRDRIALAVSPREFH